jgi:hypothetical protein
VRPLAAVKHAGRSRLHAWLRIASAGRMDMKLASRSETSFAGLGILIISLRYSQAQYENIGVIRRGSISIEYK